MIICVSVCVYINIYIYVIWENTWLWRKEAVHLQGPRLQEPKESLFRVLDEAATTISHYYVTPFKSQILETECLATLVWISGQPYKLHMLHNMVEG